MFQRRAPFLLGLVVAALLVLRGPAQPMPNPPAPDAEPSPALAAIATAGTKEGTGPAATPTVTRMTAATREYVRLYRELLGIEKPEKQPAAAPSTQVRGTAAVWPVSLDISPQPNARSATAADLKAIAEAAAKGCNHLEFMIALAADPLDSGLASDFDLTMSALQMGLSEAGYRLGSQWLPWIDAEAVDQKSYRESAGMMLFHRQSPPAPSSPPSCAAMQDLLAVFVVGETLKAGIHKAAFEQAVALILDLHAEEEKLAPAAPNRGLAPTRTAPHLEIPVLGPSYSGSAASLRVAAAGARPGTCFRVVSGSASAPALQDLLEKPLANAAVQLAFQRTVVRDDVLAEAGLRFLESRLGWDLDKAALLVERDTAYGSFFSGIDADPRRNRLLSRLTRLTFPSGLFALRNAWEASAGSPPAAPAGAANLPAAAPRTALDVSLADLRAPVDVVPELSPLTARIYDMAMADLLREISREGFSYVGILATDVKDQLFLAEQIRRWAPTMILFVVDNNLLYVHPQYNTATFGMLTISSFPLLTEGRLRLASPAIFDARVRRQFASERQEGSYLAVRALLRQPDAHRTAVWIAASGNFAMWPLARIAAPSLDRPAPPPAYPAPADVGELGPRAAPPPRADEPRPRLRPPRERTDLTLVLLAFVACLVRLLLRKEAYDWAETRRRMRILMRCALALLCLAGAFLVGLWIVKLLSDSQAGTTSLRTCLLGVPLAPAWIYLAWPLLAWPSLPRRWRRAGHPPAARLGWRRAPRVLKRLGARAVLRRPFLLLTLPVLTLAVFWLWRVDDGGLFYLRARAFSGGISPLISLAWLGAAGFLWLVVELKRQWVLRRHEVRWPLICCPEPVLEGCAESAQQIDRWMRPTVPPGRWIWLAILAIVAPPIVFLATRMQPIGESRRYGLVFLALAAVLSVVSAMAFLRFLRVWMLLRGMLHRIAQTDLQPSLKAVAAEMGWQPTHLGWYEPPFTALKASSERLQRLIDGRLVPPALATRRESLSILLAGAFAAASGKRPGEELGFRRRINHRCDQACGSLAAHRWRQDVKEFYAVRLVAYLRHVFNQLRYSVMGAMGCGLVLIAGTATYAFQPKEFAILTLWATLAAASAALLVTFLQMEWDATLSAIGGTEPGKITFDWHFLSKILLYIVPLVGLIASQFPSAGRTFSNVVDPLLRALGTG